MRQSMVGVAAVVLVLAACGGAATPTAGPANQLVYTADLKPTNEVPPIADTENAGSGSATVTFDLTRDSGGKITAATAKVAITLTGFPSTTAIILSHIHQAAAGQNGGVKVDFGLNTSPPIAVSGGGATISKTGITVDPTLMQQIIDGPAGFYVNVHSQKNPGGVVRGQLQAK